MEAEAEGTDKIKLLYEQVCINIRTTDEISFRLLGFVPLVSGVGITVLVANQTFLVQPLALFAGVVGAVVTAGLLMWELRNMQICDELISTGAVIEKDLGLPGQYLNRPKAGEMGGLRIGKTQAVKVIYSATIVAWLLLPVIASWSDIQAWIKMPR